MKKKRMKDRVSRLPDEILCHILSFLPTKEVVATSVLSKRWKPLWRSVSVLDFDDANYHYGSKKVCYSRFVESVHAGILSRDFNQQIQKFRLVLSKRLNKPATLSVWVNALLQRRVEHLDISLPFRSLLQPRANSSSIFSCRTLVVLKLEGLYLKQFSSVDLPFVKVLHLQSLLLLERGCLAELLSGCPVLEDLKVKRLYFPSHIQTPSNLSFFSCKTLVVLKLDWLQLEHFSSVDLPFLKVLHLQFTTLPDKGCLAELLSGCPVLEDLKTKIYFKKYDNDNDKELNTLPNLVRADISAQRTNIIMMKVVSNVQFLRIHEIFTFPYDGEGMFHNLIHIELVYDYYIRDWFEVVEFLNYCPKLQVLIINQPDLPYSKHDELDLEDWQYPQTIPECILLHLEECYLNGYRGTEGDFQFAKYIMQNGRLLNNMIICSSTAVNQQGRLKNIRKLSSCRRCSTACNLSFM